MLLRISVLLYPGGEQIPYRRRVMETERRNGGEGLMGETTIDRSIVRIISEEMGIEAQF